MRGDVETLAAMRRDSAGKGECKAAAWVAGRFAQAGVEDVAIEAYRGRTTYTVAQGVHLAAGVFGPRLLAVAALAGYELEVSGRWQWCRWPSGQGANVVARIPAHGAARRTVVVVAHHDAAHTGFVWHPRIVQFGAQRNLARRRIDGFGWPVVAAIVLRLIGARRAAAVLGSALMGALVTVARGAVVPGASDNATGVAALIALAEEVAADPLPETDVIFASVGCEETGMSGMRAFLDAHPLDPATTFVLSLDTLGAGTPIVLGGEGVVFEHRYAEAELDRVDAVADAAGLPRPERWRIGGWTDPILARFRGIPAVSLLSMGPGYFPHYHLPSDLPDHVDWGCVQACFDLARAIVRA